MFHNIIKTCFFLKVTVPINYLKKKTTVNKYQTKFVTFSGLFIKKYLIGFVRLSQNARSNHI